MSILHYETQLNEGDAWGTYDVFEDDYPIALNEYNRTTSYTELTSQADVEGWLAETKADGRIFDWRTV